MNVLKGPAIVGAHLGAIAFVALVWAYDKASRRKTDKALEGLRAFYLEDCQDDKCDPWESHPPLGGEHMADAIARAERFL